MSKLTRKDKEIILAEANAAVKEAITANLSVVVKTFHLPQLAVNFMCISELSKLSPALDPDIAVDLAGDMLSLLNRYSPHNERLKLVEVLIEGARNDG